LDEKFLSVKELCQRYGLGRTVFFRWAAKGLFPRGCHFGRARRWSLSELQQWEQSRLAEATA